MNSFKNNCGKSILLSMVSAILDNKAYLSEVDGLIGDGDHGVNMAKGFSMFASRIADKDISFSDGLDELGTLLFNEIGGSMGPIYGTIFMAMAETGAGQTEITTAVLAQMLAAAQDSLFELVDARLGDKTLVDTLSPACDALQSACGAGLGFSEALDHMKQAAERGRDSTKDMVAKYGRSSGLGERSRGVLDAGAASCCLLLCAMADGIKDIL